MAAMGNTKAVRNHPAIYSYLTRRGQRYLAVAMHGGKQKWLRGYTTIRAAEIAREAEVVAMRNGASGAAPARLTLGSYIDSRWWPHIMASDLTLVTTEGYSSQLRHVRRHLGEKRLSRLTALDVESFKQGMVAAGVGPTMRKLAFARLRQMLRQAMKWGLISTDPSALVDGPVPPKHRAPILSIEQIEGLLSEADATPYGALIHLVVFTGLRFGEVERLKWADVDFANSRLHVAQAKTDAGVAFVPLGAKTLERLQQHRLEQMRHFTELGGPAPQLVFTTKVGEGLRRGRFYHSDWNPLRKRVGLGELHFHDLRHVHSTLMALAKVHPSVMQRRMRHANARTTLDIYTEVDVGPQREAADAVEALFQSQT